MIHQPRNRAKVLLTGDYESPQFQSAVAWLNDATDVDCVRELSDAGVYLERLDADPLLIVVAQSYPGQYSSFQIEQLHRRSPLSRLVALLGSWCEGEVRSARPWPGVIRVYWHQFQSQLGQLLSDLNNFQLLAQLPRTSTVPEQLEAVAAASRRIVKQTSAARSQPAEPVETGLSITSHEGLIAVRTRRFNDFDALGEALRQVGYWAVWLPDTGWRNIRGATAIIWDAGHCDWPQPRHLSELRSLSETAPVVALMDFPRHDDRRRIVNAGASAIVSRPFLLSDLTYQIERLAETASRPARVA